MELLESSASVTSSELKDVPLTPSSIMTPREETLDSLQEPLLSSQEDEQEPTQEESTRNGTTTTTTTTTTLHNDDDNPNNPIHKNITFSTPTCCGLVRPRTFSMNHNVLLNLVLCALYGVSDSLWSGTVLAAYLKQLGHSENSWVGNVEAANGLASLLSALPVGYLADHWGRAKILRVGGVLLVVTAMLHALLMQWIGVDDQTAGQEHPHTELLLAGIMALWGVGGGIVMGPSQALFADSTPQGKRSEYYLYLFVCFSLSSCMGPLVSIVLFQTMGDDWDLYDLRIIIYVGMGLEAMNGVLMMFFDDRKALDEPEDCSAEIDAASEEENSSPCEEEEEEEDPLLSPDVEQPLLADDTTQVTQNASNTNNHNHNTLRQEYKKYIPYILFVHSLVFSLGSGMTVKFFPLFFKDQVGMSPTQVQVVYFIVPLVLAAFSGLGQSISNKIGLGRVPTAFLFKATGASLLFSMVLFKHYLDSRPLLLVPIYSLRTALMNASYPLEESILMDNVPKKERGRWKSLESIAVFGWCGSAALGGWASDHAHGDYTFTFLITACIQAVGALVWCLLWPLVDKEQPVEAEATTTDQPTHHQRSPSDVSEEAFYDAVQHHDDLAAYLPPANNSLQAKFPTLSAADCDRFQAMFGEDPDNVVQMLDEYVRYRTLYKLDSAQKQANDAQDWQWAAQLALETAKTHPDDLLPGVEGLALRDRVCELSQLPQLCFAHKFADASPIVSRQGHPIVHYLAGRLDNNRVSSEIHALSITLYLEQKALELNLDSSASVGNNNNNKCVLMVDARKGQGWPNHSVLMVAGFLKTLTKALVKFHPGRLEKLIIYPVPFAGVYAFKMMKKWLPPIVAQNIVLVNGSDAVDAPVPEKELLKYVSREALDEMERVRKANFD